VLLRRKKKNRVARPVLNGGNMTPRENCSCLSAAGGTLLPSRLGREKKAEHLDIKVRGKKALGQEKKGPHRACGRRRADMRVVFSGPASGAT